MLAHCAEDPCDLNSLVFDGPEPDVCRYADVASPRCASRRYDTCAHIDSTSNWSDVNGVRIVTRGESSVTPSPQLVCYTGSEAWEWLTMRCYRDTAPAFESLGSPHEFCRHCATRCALRP
jgi:hypothetical protein